MSDLDLSALRKVAEAATPGPWTFQQSGGVRGKGRRGEFRARSPHNGFMLVGPWVNSGDPDFMSAFDPPTVLALLDELETLRAQVSDG